MKPITVLLADDHTIVREGFRALLQLEADITVIGEARDGREAVELAVKLRPEVVVMDVAMPQLNGLGAARQIVEALPDTRVIMLSAYSDDPYIHRALAVGATGFLIKQASAQCLAKAIRAVKNGKSYFSPSIAKRIHDHPREAGKPRAQKVGKGLTEREREVIQLISEGATNKQIAGELKISIKTVEKHRQRVMDKLNIRNTAGLTRYAIVHGIIETSVRVMIV